MNTAIQAHPSQTTLSNLHEVPLAGLSQAILDAAQLTCAGPAAVRLRLIAEARDLLVLAQISGRLHVHWLELTAGLRAKIEMDVPVACLPDPAGALQVRPGALLGLLYPSAALLTPQPGYAFVRILQPRSIWHSTVSADVNQALCLGPSLPAGIALREIVLMTYGALSMQTVQLDAVNPAGVLNPAAAEWWQGNTSRIPLSREPFLRPEVPHDR